MDKEQRADWEERTGRYKEFNLVDELIKYLHEPDEPTYYTCPWCGLVFYPQSASDIHCGGIDGR